MKFYLLVGFIVLLVILVRLINLLEFPLYLDEGIYIFWARLFYHSPSFAYISLLDGKTPLYMWLVAGAYHFTQQSLLSGRLVSVLAGGVTALSWMLIMNLISGKKVALLTGGLLLALPYAFLIERMAFADSLLTAMGGLAFLFFVLGRHELTKKNHWQRTIICAFLSGLFLGLAYITKTPAIAFLIAQTVILCVWITESLVKRKFFNSIVYGVSGVISYLTYKEVVGYVRFGGYRFWDSVGRNEEGLVYSLPNIFSNLVSYDGLVGYLNNANVVGSYLVAYVSGLLIFSLIGIIFILRKRRDAIPLLVYLGILFFGILLSAKVISSRYFYPAIPSMVAIGALSMVKIWESELRWSKIASVVVVLLLIGKSMTMLIGQKTFVYAGNERTYLSGIVTAWGLGESIEVVLRSEEKDETIVGVNAIWGVSDGSILTFEESGIKAVNIEELFVSTDPGLNSSCQLGFVFSDENTCMKLNIDSLSGFKNKYLYLPGDVDIDLISKIHKVKAIEEFPRPNSDLKVYLVKLE